MKEHIFNIHDVIILMTIAECVLLALFQAVLPVVNRTASNLLSFFLVCVAVGSACTMILWHESIHTTQLFDQLFLPYFLVAGILLKGPVLYLYVTSLTVDGFKLQPKHLIHLLPLVACIIYMQILGIDGAHLNFSAVNVPPAYNNLVNVVWHLSKFVPLFYSIAAVIATRRYYQRLKNQYSYFSPTEPGWLRVLSNGFMLSFLFSLSVHLIAQYANPQMSDALGIAEIYFVFILINALFTYSIAYAHKLLTTKQEPLRERSDETLTDVAIAKVEHGMKVDKFFLKQNLNIEEFSRRIDLPVKEVSSVINKHYKTNFFEFMNSYRVEEAKRLLTDPQSAQMTILDILLQSGFNSKSAFHRFFNRLVGISPSEYRKQQTTMTNTSHPS